MKASLRLVIFFGLVSLFADMTYEGARSIMGPYLAVLGASGAIVGIVAGLGEFVGYTVRLLSGYVSDKTKAYWSFTIIGYCINLIAVPALALAGYWPMAASLLILERFGKAIRTPARDAMLSFATKELGRGWGFGLHEAMDQCGAILGPLIISTVLFFGGSYREGYAILLLPALCALIVLFATWRKYPNPIVLEKEVIRSPTGKLPKQYWIYIAGVSLVAAGYVDFALIAFHFEKTRIVTEAWIPILFCIAMAADGVAALVCGKLFDRWGMVVLAASLLFSSLFALFIFTHNVYLILIGTILWGIGLGAQESVMRAVVALLSPIHLRGTAYGLLNFWFGLFWFLGSALMGLLYDHSIPYLIAFSIGCHLVAVPIIYSIKT